jgi:hypothetical protein
MHQVLRYGINSYSASNCIGIHRSLGVHISKVRSLLLDKLEAEHIEVHYFYALNVDT